MLKHLATCLLGLAAILAASMPAAAEKRVALVVGNAAYENVPPLQNPSNDATDIAAKLRGLGFEVVEGIDLGKRDMEKHIRAFADALNGADVGLFYYAGHGLQVDQRNFLAPVDAQLKSEVDLRLRGGTAQPRVEADGAQRPHQHRVPRRLPRQPAGREPRSSQPLSRCRPRPGAHRSGRQHDGGVRRPNPRRLRSTVRGATVPSPRHCCATSIPRARASATS